MTCPIDTARKQEPYLGPWQSKAALVPPESPDAARLQENKLQPAESAQLSSKLAEMNSVDDIYKHRRDNATRNDQVDVQALAAAADVFAKTAQAALMSLNSVVSATTNAFS